MLGNCVMYVGIIYIIRVYIARNNVTPMSTLNGHVFVENASVNFFFLNNWFAFWTLTCHWPKCNINSWTISYLTYNIAHTYTRKFNIGDGTKSIIAVDSLKIFIKDSLIADRMSPSWESSVRAKQSVSRRAFTWNVW